MTTSVRLLGVRECIADIRRLGYRVTRVHNRNAVSAAAGVMRREMERTAPVESGAIKANVRVRVGVKKRNGEWFAAIGIRRKAKAKPGSRAKSIRQAVTYRKGGAARRITEARATKLLAAGGRVAYRSPARYVHLTEKRNTSSKGWVSSASARQADEAARAAIRQLQKAIKEEARRG